MGGCDQVDVMTTDLLKVNHHIRQVLITDFLSLSFMSDRPVLAEDTAEIAIGEEDGARSMLPHQRYLLAEMGLSDINYNSGRGSTEPLFAISAINPALSGAQPAFLEK